MVDLQLSLVAVGHSFLYHACTHNLVTVGTGNFLQLTKMRRRRWWWRRVLAAVRRGAAMRMVHNHLHTAAQIYVAMPGCR